MNEVTTTKHTPLQASLKQQLEDYFAHLDGSTTTNIYHMVLNEIEKPLLETIMKFVANNKTLAAKMLGLSRNTLRQLLIKHKITDGL